MGFRSGRTEARGRVARICPDRRDRRNGRVPERRHSARVPAVFPWNRRMLRRGRRISALSPRRLPRCRSDRHFAFRRVGGNREAAGAGPRANVGRGGDQRSDEHAGERGRHRALCAQFVGRIRRHPNLHRHAADAVSARHGGDTATRYGATRVGPPVAPVAVVGCALSPTGCRVADIPDSRRADLLSRSRAVLWIGIAERAAVRRNRKDACRRHGSCDLPSRARRGHGTALPRAAVCPGRCDGSFEQGIR